MSRIANMPVLIPSNVEFNLTDSELTVKGPEGNLALDINQHVKVISTEMDDEKIKGKVFTFEARSKDKRSDALAGTTRALVNNMVEGVSEGFEKALELYGVGYRAQLKGKVLDLTLGFSHPIEYVLPEGITCEIPPKQKQPTIILKCCDKQKLGQVAAEIRAFRPPEPYKGKGIRYRGEVIVRKETKKK